MPRYIKAEISPLARYGTMRDVEKRNRISQREQYRLLRAGKIKAKKQGMMTLIDLQSVDEHQASLPDYGSLEARS
jgi:hypothetical protein